MNDVQLDGTVVDALGNFAGIDQPAAAQEARARREAAALIFEHGTPRSLDTLTALLALAYAKGALDATTETADALRAAS